MMTAMVATPTDYMTPGAVAGASPRRKKPRRPALGLIVVASIAYRFGRGMLVEVAPARWQVPVGLVLTVAFFALVIGWRLHARARTKRQGTEHSPDAILRELANSGVGGPAFPEDGTLLGASVIVMNQHTKVLEINTGYELYGSGGQRLGEVRQVRQSGFKKVFRFIGPFDQYFTHHFDVLDNAGTVILSVTRPAKVFKSRLIVRDGYGRPYGQLRQQNVFGRIRFALIGADGFNYGTLKAENLRAWDFRVVDYGGQEVASITKTWEGWMRAAVTRADHYIIRIHWQLPEPLRALTWAGALAVDVALKQDSRGLAG